MSSAQVGKTEILNNILAYFIAYDPCPILFIQPTLEMAEAWSKDRLAPMLRDTPMLTSKVKDPASRNSGNTLRHKEFPGGQVVMAGANSPASLASRPIRVLLGDERDRWPISVGTEGDPWKLGAKRTTTFWNRKLVQVSTPTIKDISAIEAEYQNSSQEHYIVPCPYCETQQMLRWPQVRWDGDDLDSACYHCEACDQPWTDVQRWAALGSGRWVASHPDRKKRGFHLNEIYSPWVELAGMARAWIAAKDRPEALKTFVNTSLGETWDDRSEQLNHEQIYNRRESWDVLPSRAVFLTGGVDIQKDRIEVEVVAWSRDLESWSVLYQQIFGDPHRPEVWNELTPILQSKFSHESGNELHISGTCLDTGGHHTSEAYAYCKGKPHLFAIKGRGGAGYSSVIMSSRNNSHKVRLFSLGVDTIKGRVVQNLRVTTPGDPGYCHFPMDRTMPYFHGLTSEYTAPKILNGQRTLMWVQIPGTNNEPFDLRVYATAAIDILRPRWDLLERTFNGEDMEEPEPQRMPVRRPSHQRPKSDYVKRW